jgi:hypothetical protein
VRVSWHALQRGDLRTAEAFARRAAELDPQAEAAGPATDFGQAASAVLATARELAGPHERAATLDERAVQLVARAEQIMAGMHLPCAITPRVPPGGAW